jgi:Carboxypeptidase regulatory-like domain
MRRTAAIAISAVFLGLLTAPTPARAADTPATVTGTITDAETGAPLPGACAHLYTSVWEELATACADDAGHYVTPQLQANLFFWVKFSAAGHADRWAPQEPTVFTSGQYVVSTTDSKTIDTSLPTRTGTISGRITDPEGRGESLIHVDARVGGVTKASARTKTDGTYELPGLVPGTYDIVTYSGCLATVTVGTFGVAASGSVTADFHYQNRICTPTNLTFAGKVIDGLTGTAIPGVSYRVVHQPYNFEVAAGVSDSTGAYQVDGLTPSPLYPYRVQASAAGYPQQWANGGLTMTTGGTFNPGVTEIPLTAEWGGLQGKITGPDGQPVQATVVITGTDRARGRLSQVSAADGSYSFPKLAPGDWILRISNSQLGLQWYPQLAPTGSSITPPPNAGHIKVGPGSVTTVNEQFAERSHLEVTLRDTVSGQPITDGCVSGGSLSVPPICTNTNGVYRLDLPPNTSGWIGASSPSAFPINNGAVAMPAGQTVPVTLSMRPAGRITVPIQHNPDGSVPPVCVIVVPKTQFSTPAGQLWLHWCNTNGASPTDTITTGQLELGPVQLFVVAEDSSQGSQWLGAQGGTGQRERAAVIDVRRGSNQSPVVKLDPSAYVWGYIRGDVSGAGIAVLAGGMTPGFHSWCEEYNHVYADCTNNDDEYDLRLGPYAWPLEAFMSTLGMGWSGGAASRADAQLVQLEAGKSLRYDLTTRYGGDFTLDVPDGTTGWRIETFDAKTGDAAGVFVDHTVSSVARGPHLLHAAYTTNGVQMSCWLYQYNGPTRKLNPIFYAGFDGKSTRLTIRPGVTCLNRIPALLKLPTRTRAVFDPELRLAAVRKSAGTLGTATLTRR